MTTRLIACLILAFFSARALAVDTKCPFCSTLNSTLSEQFKLNDLAVIATLAAEAPVANSYNDLPVRRFKIKRILKGENFIASGAEFSAVLKGKHSAGEQYLVWGMGPPEIVWSEPIASNAQLERYLDEIQKLPEKGAERLAFFQDYFEHAIIVLASDAYDEFAIATYEELLAMKEMMSRTRLLELIQDAKVEENNRRLYLTMLGICGAKEDTHLLETLLTSKEPSDRRGLDALVACYLCLNGAEGLPLIERLFLVGTEADYSKAQQVIAALRFHGTEVDIVGREPLVRTMQRLLDRPRLADIVIPDLARWEDWTVMDRLVEMFKLAGKDSAWIRVPVFKYLQVCPLPAAKQHIEELKLIDSAAYQRAVFLSRIKVSVPEEATEDQPEEPAVDRD